MYNELAIPSTMTNLQQNAQANLPVIPNNGNPQGANNMPFRLPTQQPAVLPQQPAPAPDPYAWLQPSPHMDMIQQILNQPLLHRGLYENPPPQMAPNDPPQPVQPQGVPTLPHEGRPPVLPLPQGLQGNLHSNSGLLRPEMPVLPQGRFNQGRMMTN